MATSSSRSQKKFVSGSDSGKLIDSEEQIGDICCKL